MEQSVRYPSRKPFFRSLTVISGWDRRENKKCPFHEIKHATAISFGSENIIEWLKEIQLFKRKSSDPADTPNNILRQKSVIVFFSLFFFRVARVSEIKWQ